VFIFVSYNNVGIILEEATIIVEKNGSNTQRINQELGDLMHKYEHKYSYKTEFMNQQNFLESTRIIMFCFCATKLSKKLNLINYQINRFQPLVPV
jgi:hypothetical protein